MKKDKGKKEDSRVGKNSEEDSPAFGKLPELPKLILTKSSRNIRGANKSMDNLKRKEPPIDHHAENV